MNKTLINLLVYTFILMYGLNVFAQKEETPKKNILEKVIAVVGDQAVLNSDVEEQYFQMKARGIYPDKDEKCKIFENLLFQKLLIVQSEIDSISVLESQVVEEVDGRIDEFVKQIGSVEALEDYFGKSLPEIKESFMSPIHDQLLARKMQMEITKDVKITPSEVKKYFTKLPKDSLPLIDATYEIAQIQKKPSMTEEEEKQQRKKLNEIRQRIVDKGESFKTLAILYSEDPGSASKGGLMKNATRGSLVPEFASALFNLEEGEVSEIVQTEYGIHIIRLEKKHGDKVDFRHILLTPKVSAKANLEAKEYLDSIANVVRTDTLTFEQAAALFSDDDDTRLNGGIMINPYTRTAQFEAKHISPSINYVIKNMNVGEISNAFSSKNRSGQVSYKIVMLRNKTKAHHVNINDDYQMIKEMALENKRQDIVRDWIKDVKDKVYIKIDAEYSKCKFTMYNWNK